MVLFMQTFQIEFQKMFIKTALVDIKQIDERFNLYTIIICDSHLTQTL